MRAALLAVLLLGAAARGQSGGGAAVAVDEPARQVFDLSAEAGAPAFVTVQLAKGLWRRADHTAWGRPRTMLARGADYRRVPTADGPMEDSGFAVEYEARGKRALSDVAEALYAAWQKAGHKVTGEPTLHKSRKLKLKKGTLEAVVWQWAGEHALTKRAIATTMAVCKVGDAVLVLSGWDLMPETTSRSRRQRHFRTFSPSGIFQQLVSATTVTAKRPKARVGRFKLSDSITKGRYYMTAKLPPGLEQGGGPYPAGTAACAVRREGDRVTARFRVFGWRQTKGSLEAEVELLDALVRKKYAHVAEPKSMKIGVFAAYVLAFRDEPYEARTVVFLADGNVWAWSFRTAAEGDALAKDLAAFEKTTLKTAQIWWRRRR